MLFPSRIHLARAGLLLFLVGLWQLLWVWGLPAYVLGPVDIVKHFFAALGSQIGRRLAVVLPQGGATERPAADLRRPARVARAVLHRHVRHRDDQCELRAGPPHPRRGERAALRPDVRVARHHRDPRLRRRSPAAPRAPARARLAGTGRMSRLSPFLLIGLALVAWELAARSGLWSPLLFPSLASIAHELGLLLSRADRLMEAWYSLYRALGGFALAAVVGVALGMLMGRSAFAAGLLEPLFSGTYAVPKLALFPIFIFVFGIGRLSTVALVFLECLYPIVIITSQGARNVNRALLWSAQKIGASRMEILRRIVIPATAPFIFAGFRVALPVAMIVVVITEMISSADGLGYQVIYALSSLKTDRMLALVVVIALLGWLLDRSLVALRDRLVYWEKLETYYV